MIGCFNCTIFFYSGEPECPGEPIEGPHEVFDLVARHGRNDHDRHEGQSRLEVGTRDQGSEPERQYSFPLGDAQNGTCNEEETHDQETRHDAINEIRAFR